MVRGAPHVKLDEVDGRVACTNLRWGVMVGALLDSLETGAHRSQSVAAHGANGCDRFVAEAAEEYPRVAGP